MFDNKQIVLISYYVYVWVYLGVFMLYVHMCANMFRCVYVIYLTMRKAWAFKTSRKHARKRRTTNVINSPLSPCLIYC